MTYQSINPYDGKTLKTFKELTDAELETKIAAAQACFKTWRRIGARPGANIIVGWPGC